MKNIKKSPSKNHHKRNINYEWNRPTPQNNFNNIFEENQKRMIHQEDQKEEKYSIQNTQSTKSTTFNTGAATFNSVAAKNSMNMMRLTRQEIQTKKLNQNNKVVSSFPTQGSS